MFDLENNDKITGPAGRRRWSINMEAVWGQMTIGGGATHLNESLAAMNVPGMNTMSFSLIEAQIGEMLKKGAAYSNAGGRERGASAGSGTW